MGNAIRMTRSLGGIYRVPFAIGGERIRAIAVVVAKGFILLAFAYAASIAWDPLQELRHVKLYQLRQVLRVASVGDLLLLWATYVFCREFIRALGRRSTPPG